MGASMGVGHAAAAAEGAAAIAARAALGALGDAPLRAALVFLPYRGLDHRKAVKAVREVLGPDAALVGATTYGEIVAGRPVEGEVVVVAIGGDGVAAATALGRGVGAAPRDVAETAAREALAGLGGAAPRLLFVVYDPLAGGMRGVLEGFHAVVGDAGFPIVGAGSGTGDMAETRPLSLQVAGDKVVGGSIAVLALGGELAVAGVGASGCRRLGGPYEVTGVAGPLLTGLDGRRALDVYMAVLGGSEQVSRESAEGEAQEAQVLRVTPRGAPPGSHSILAPYSLDAETGAITLAVTLSPGDRVEVVAIDHAAYRARLQDSLTAGLARLDGAPIGALVSDCFGYKVTLRSRVGEELAPLAGALRGAPIAGMYSGGEIGNVAGGEAPVSWFSNFLVSAAVLASR